MELREEKLAKRIKKQYGTSANFLKEFEGRCPSRNTVAKFFNSDFAKNGTQNKTFQTTCDKIEKCLNIPNWMYWGYENLKRQCKLGDQEEEDALQYIGNYRYYRPNPYGKIVDGGLFLGNHFGVNYFYHFNQFSKLEDYHALSDKKKAAQNIHDLVSHIGFFFVQNRRINFSSMEETYFRPITGIVKRDLSKEYLRLIVTTSHTSGTLFSAKSIAIHESNKRYKIKAKDEDVRIALSIDRENPGFITLH